MIPHLGQVRELKDGTILALPGQVFSLRIQNHSSRRAVAHVSLDGSRVTDGGLVLEAARDFLGRDVILLERCVNDSDAGRFTAFAEGDTGVFGAAGGRDNPDLGLISVELRRAAHAPPVIVPATYYLQHKPDHRYLDNGQRPGILRRSWVNDGVSFHHSTAAFAQQEPTPVGAMGTGLTGHSDQTFVTVSDFPLEDSSTVVNLRLVEGTPEQIAEARPLPKNVRGNPAPARPTPGA